MKKIYITFLLVCLLGSMVSCNYLDIVPDERPTEKDAFKDKKAAERYLYSCYAFLFKERRAQYLYQTGEVVTDYGEGFLRGNYSAADPGDFRFWSSMYGGIKRCHTLIDNIDNVPRLEDELKVTYKAEAKFLIAYYHFYLLRAYGPILLADHDMDIETPSVNYPKRSSFDTCVDWIANLFDEAYNDLPEEYVETEYGRATKLAAKSLKGRLLLYAASPLFNGNSEFYANELLDPDTKEPLMNLTYDSKKWNRALEACQTALAMAETQKYSLFKATSLPNDAWTSLTEYTLRMSFMDKTNMDVIWADTRKEDTYGPQNQCAPRDNKDPGNSWNGVAPTLDVIKNFYTKNGLPISEDPEYFSPEEYFQIGKYDGENTCKLNLDREPRFYSWISFHNGWFEMQRKSDKRIRTKLKFEDPHGQEKDQMRDFSRTGYLIKKLVHPNYHTNNGFTNYPWPLIRMAELYLNVAEAAAEANELDIAKKALNEVRIHAGIPTVETSWKGIADLTQSKLIDIIRQERTIEFFFEGHYSWDIRRWKKAEKILGKNPQGLNVGEKEDAEFFKPTTINMLWRFTSPTNYLLPIRDREININQKIVQNPGY